MSTKIGVIFPSTEIGHDFGAVKEYIQAVDSLGYDHLLILDHILGADTEHYPGWTGTYRLEHAFREPFVFLAYLAAVAPRLEPCISVLVLPNRQTALVAKQAAELDILCGGRLRLGVGVGWNPVEFEAMGQNIKNRGRRIDEQISLLRSLWTTNSLNYTGTWNQVTHAGINPLPTQRPIPIWMGGSSEPMMRRVAKLGNGWFPHSNPVPFNFEDGSGIAKVERVRGYMRELGRDPKELDIDGHLDAFSDRSPSQWANEVPKWQSIDAGYVSLNTMRCGFTNPSQHIDAIRKFKEALG